MVTKDILLNGVIVGSHESTGDTDKDIEAVREFLKKNGLHKVVTVNDAMYGQANAFAGLANDIYERDLQKSPYKGSSGAPFIVNATFSIELYLKTIHDVYGNKIKGHHLAKLYQGMPQKGKEQFLGAANDVRHHYCLEAGSDIHSCLDALSKAFEQWRYLYEHDRMGTELQSIRYAMHVSHEACCRVRESVKNT